MRLKSTFSLSIFDKNSQPIMKKLIFILAILSSGILVQAQKLMKPSENKSMVYFVRTSSMGFAINFKYFDGKEYIGKFKGKGYLAYECEPGKHLFWASSENVDFIEATLEAGKTYVILAVPMMGAIKAAVALSILDFSDKKDVKKVGKVVGNTPPPYFSTADLTESQDKYENLIAKSIKKYQSYIAAGNNYPEIVAGMEAPEEYLTTVEQTFEFLN